MTIDIEPLRKQLGRKIEDEDVVTRAPLKAMIATFDRPEGAGGGPADCAGPASLLPAFPCAAGAAGS